MRHAARHAFCWAATGLTALWAYPSGEAATSRHLWRASSVWGVGPVGGCLPGPLLEGSNPRNGTRDCTCTDGRRRLPSTPAVNEVYPRRAPDSQSQVYSFPGVAWDGGIRCGAGARASPPHLSFRSTLLPLKRYPSRGAIGTAHVPVARPSDDLGTGSRGDARAHPSPKSEVLCCGRKPGNIIPSRVCSVTSKFQKFYKISHHIESLDACMKH
jgi:hypothetical protein